MLSLSISRQNRNPTVGHSVPLALASPPAPPLTSPQAPNPSTIKYEVRPFKIRTCSNKGAGQKSSEVEGKKIMQVLAVEMHNREPEESTPSVPYLIRRPSLNHHPTPQDKSGRRLNASRNSKKNKQEAMPFKEIEIFSAEKSSLHFQSIDLRSLSALGHRPTITLNSSHIESGKTLLIVSMRVLNPQPRKYLRTNDRAYLSQKSVQSNIGNQMSLQTCNLVRSLSSQQSPHSLLGQCKIVYKVSSELEAQELESYLQSSQLSHWHAILQLNTHCQPLHLYNIRSLVSRDSKVILIEDKDTLNFQLPLLEGQRALMLSPKTPTVPAASQLIKALKQGQFEELNSTPSRLNQDKQNINPNIRTIIAFRTSKLSPTTHKKRDQQILAISLSTQSQRLSLPWIQLLERNKQAQRHKQLRHNKKQIRNSPSGELASFKRDHSLSKHSKREGHSVDKSRDSAPSGSLEGPFKEKMVQFVKILQSELPPETKKDRVREEKGQDELELLTTTLTSRLRSKTGYQLVGDLLRNNNHIAKQIGNYMQKIGPLQLGLSSVLDNYSEVPTLEFHQC